MGIKKNQWKPPHLYENRVTIRISVPVHSNKPLKLGLQSHLMKIAQINEAEL